MKKVVLIAAMLLAFGLGGAAAFAGTADKPPAPPGQPDCEHGNSDAACKEDPQPNHGQDCQEHGNKGGQNEDHCLDGTPTETTPTETTPTESTPTGTTPTETTPTESTPKDTTPTETTTGATTPTETTGTPPSQSPLSAGNEQGATSAKPASTPNAGGQVFAPPAAPQAKGKDTSESVAAVTVAASQPGTAPQSAPFTP